MAEYNNKQTSKVRAGRIKQPRSKGVAKVPVIMQLEALECGATCLAMVAAYYGKYLPLEQIRNDCGVSRDGVTAQGILQAARSYGFEAQGYRFDVDELKQNAKYPCIIHWNFNHFVVLDGFRGGKAYLHDPARGPYTVEMSEFSKSFAGMCLEIKPSKDFVPSGKPQSILAFAKKRLKGSKHSILFVMVATLIASLLALSPPLFNRVFVDDLLPGENPEWIVPVLVLMAAMACASMLVRWIQAIYQYRIEGSFAAVATSGFMMHALRLPLDFYLQRMVGDVVSREATNESIAHTLLTTLAPIAFNIIMVVIYVVAMVHYSMELTCVGLISIMINIGLARILSSKRINYARLITRDTGKLDGTTMAGIKMIETLKSSGAENGFFQRWAGLQARVNEQTVNHVLLNETWGLLLALVSAITNVLIMILGVELISQGAFTVGMLMAFQGFFSSLMLPVSHMVESMQVVQEMRTNMERVEDVMEYKEDDVFVPHEGASFALPVTRFSGAVELRDVTFGYSKTKAPLIDCFNLKLAPGKSVALVGSSGCGKSTLTKLLMGLYAPWSGEILFDGKPLRSYRSEVFFTSVAAVDQETVLFEDTIANNIRMWDATIDDQAIMQAAKEAGIHEDIVMRQEGYSFKLSESGHDLSGGQRQRLEIARMLVQNPAVVIMDEATSALDAQAEHAIMHAVRQRGISLIVVAHRLSTVRACDAIVVLDEGRVVEQGTHEQLYALDGAYRRLMESR